MWELIKEMFKDILSLYKNFVHFNLSKIAIFSASFIFSVLSILPFVIILGAIFYYYLDLNIIYNPIFSFFSILGFFVITISFLYYFVLQTNLNLSYINWKRLWSYKVLVPIFIILILILLWLFVVLNYSLYFLLIIITLLFIFLCYFLHKWEFFNFKLFINYFKVMTLNLLILIVPFIIYKSLVFLIINIVWGEEQAAVLFNSEVFNYFKLLLDVLWIITLLSFIYLSYKTLFSIVILAAESKWKKFQKAFYYISKSFKLTKWFGRWAKFFVVAAIFIIIVSPITITLNYISFTENDLSNYIESKSNPEVYQSFDFYYLESLEEKFAWESLENLNIELNRYKKYLLFFEILNFLLIFGVFEMMILSFYFRELLKNTKYIDENKEVKNSQDSKNISIKKPVKKEPVKKIWKKESVKKIEKKEPVKKTWKKEPVKKIEKKESVRKTWKKPTKK